MSGQMYFGNKTRMTWVKCPSVGMGRSSHGYTAEGVFLNGGSWVRNSAGRHNAYDLNWNFLRADERQEIRAYLDNVYGNDLIYFLDPFAMGRNVLPTSWSSPGISARGGTSLVQNASGVPTTQGVPAGQRVNYGRNPEAVGTVSGSSVPGFATYQTGTGEAGTTIVRSSDLDGPRMPDGRVLGYARRTVTTPKTGGSTGWRAEAVEYRSNASGVSGDPVRTSVYVRFNASADPGAIHRTVRIRSRINGTTSNESDDIVLPRGQWTRIDVPNTATGNFTYTDWWVLQGAGSNLPAGSSLDVTGLLVEKSSGVKTYFSGASLDTPQETTVWNGTANASSSTATLSQADTPAYGASYTLNAESVSKECYLPVPEGYTLHLQGYYTRTGTAAVALVSVGGASTVLPAGTTASTSVAVTGSAGYTLKLSGVGTVNLTYLMAQILPTGQEPDFEQFIPGEGHSGCRLSGEISDVGYSAPQALDYSALSFTLRETGSWEV